MVFRRVLNGWEVLLLDHDATGCRVHEQFDRSSIKAMYTFHFATSPVVTAGGKESSDIFRVSGRPDGFWMMARFGNSA